MWREADMYDTKIKMDARVRGHDDTIYFESIASLASIAVRLAGMRTAARGAPRCRVKPNGNCRSA
jgi:hypothetical protein